MRVTERPEKRDDQAEFARRQLLRLVEELLVFTLFTLTTLKPQQQSITLLARQRSCSSFDNGPVCQGTRSVTNASIAAMTLGPEVRTLCRAATLVQCPPMTQLKAGAFSRVLRVLFADTNPANLTPVPRCFENLPADTTADLLRQSVAADSLEEVRVGRQPAACL